MEQDIKPLILGDLGPSNISSTMTRLSSKAGVQATVLLDRRAGHVLLSSGSLASIRSSTSSKHSQHTKSSSDTEHASDADNIKDFAAMVWKFVEAAGGLVNDLDNEDEVKLLRLRTKNHELVLVPDSHFIFIVVHETSPA